MTDTQETASDHRLTRPWTPPTITRELASQLDAIATKLPSANARALNETCQQLLSAPLTFSPIALRPPVEVLEPIAAIVEHSSGCRIAICIPTPLWQAALSVLLGDTPRSHVPLEAERGALLYLAARLARSALGESFHVAGITTTEETLCHALGLSELAQAKWCAQTTVHLGKAAAAVTLLCHTPLPADSTDRNERLRDVPIPCMVSCGETTLRTSELRVLTTDAVVLLDRFGIRKSPAGLEGTVRLSAVEGAALYWECVMHQGELTLQRMETDSPDPPTSANLRDLPIRLHVELARLSLTFGELETLKTGQVLRLAKSVGDRVTLSANGQPIAEGEVVDIEGELGVRIVRLELSGGA